MRQALGIYQLAAREFHTNGAFESEALSWHRISQIAASLNDSTLAKDSAGKARMLLRARTIPGSSLNTLATAQAARAYLALGRIQLESSEVREAFQSYENALLLSERANLPRETAVTKVALGLLAARADEYETAVQLTTSSIASWRAAHDFGGEAMALNNLARFSERRGDLKAAVSFDRQATEIYRFSRDRRGEDASLNESLRVNLQLSDYSSAAWACEQLVGLSRLAGNSRLETEHLLSLAAIEIRRENAGTAYQLLLKALIANHGVDPELVTKVEDLSHRFEELARTSTAQTVRNEQMLLAEQEADNGRYSAAYQLLLRALVNGVSQTSAAKAATDMQIVGALRRIDSARRR